MRYHVNIMGVEYGHVTSDVIVIWCSSLRDNHFCATKIAEPKKIVILFGLVEMFLLAKGTNPQEEIFLGSKLTEIFFLTKVKLA